MAGERIFNMQQGAIYNDIHDNEMVVVPTSPEEAKKLVEQLKSEKKVVVGTPAPKAPSSKFPYIKSDDLAEIKDIEATMEIYITGNQPSPLCDYLFDNEGTLFRQMPKRADVIFGYIQAQWGDKNKIQDTGFRTAWKRHRPE